MADSADLALRGSPGPAGTTQKCWRVFFLEKGQKQVLFSVLKIRGYKVLYLRMDLSQPMTCLCGNRQIFHISDSPSRINSSKCFSCVFMLFELSWEPEIQKFIYNQLSECIFEAQLHSIPFVLPPHNAQRFAHPSSRPAGFPKVVESSSIACGALSEKEDLVAVIRSLVVDVNPIGKMCKRQNGSCCQAWKSKNIWKIMSALVTSIWIQNFKNTGPRKCILGKWNLEFWNTGERKQGWVEEYLITIIQIWQIFWTMHELLSTIFYQEKTRGSPVGCHLPRPSCWNVSTSSFSMSFSSSWRSGLILWKKWWRNEHQTTSKKTHHQHVIWISRCNDWNLNHPWGSKVETDPTNEQTSPRFHVEDARDTFDLSQ